MPSRLRWTGGNKILQNLRSIAKNAPNEFIRAARQEGEVEKTEIRRRTPVEFGPLRASLTMDVIKRGKTIVVEFGVGGPSAPYAVYVHERTELWHKIGEAKFMERTLKESAPHWMNRIASRVSLNRMVK